jgi:hypothetical protein
MNQPLCHMNIFHKVTSVFTDADIFRPVSKRKILKAPSSFVTSVHRQVTMPNKLWNRFWWNSVLWTYNFIELTLHFGLQFVFSWQTFYEMWRKFRLGSGHIVCSFMWLPVARIKQTQWEWSHDLRRVLPIPHEFVRPSSFVYQVCWDRLHEIRMTIVLIQCVLQRRSLWNQKGNHNRDAKEDVTKNVAVSK